jgi:hypothetical protein
VGFRVGKKQFSDVKVASDSEDEVKVNDGVGLALSWLGEGKSELGIKTEGARGRRGLKRMGWSRNFATSIWRWS